MGADRYAKVVAKKRKIALKGENDKHALKFLLNRLSYFIIIWRDFSDICSLRGNFNKLKFQEQTKLPVS